VKQFSRSAGLQNRGFYGFIHSSSMGDSDSPTSNGLESGVLKRSRKPKEDRNKSKEDQGEEDASEDDGDSDDLGPLPADFASAKPAGFKKRKCKELPLLFANCRSAASWEVVP
jgi:hypothetical protein